MRFHLTGLIVFVGFLVLALVGGAGPAVAVVRFAMVIFGLAAIVEVVVNMVRHRDWRVRSRLLGLLGEQGSFTPGVRSPKR
jgi:membrane protein YdbS with pleckstrin-like domain